MLYDFPREGQILTLKQKTPVEVIGHRINLLTLQAFRDFSETFTDENSVVWKVYDSVDMSTEVSSMINDQDASVANSWIEVDLQGGTHGHLYYLKGTLTCTSGRVYVLHGAMYVFNPLLAVIPTSTGTTTTSGSSDVGMKSGEVVLTPGTTNIASSSLVRCTVSPLDATHIKIIWDIEYATNLYFFDCHGMSAVGSKIEIVPGVQDDTTKTSAYVTVELPFGVKYLKFFAHGENAA